MFYAAYYKEEQRLCIESRDLRQWDAAWVKCQEDIGPIVVELLNREAQV